MPPQKPPVPLSTIVHYFLDKWAHSPYRAERLFRNAKEEPLSVRHSRVKALYDNSFFSDLDNTGALIKLIVERVQEERQLSPALHEAFIRLLVQLAVFNNLFFTLPTIPDHLPISEERDLTNVLADYEYRLIHDETIVNRFGDASTALVAGIASALAQSADGSVLSIVALRELLSDPGECFDKLLMTFLKDLITPDNPPAMRTFEKTIEQLYKNLLTISRLTPEDAHKHPHRLVIPSKSDLEGEALPRAYFAHTPFEKFFETDLPFTIPRKSFTEHGAIFAPSGHGKTQLLQHLITNLLHDPDPPGMFILDSQGSMLRKLEKLAIFDGALKDRLVILDPPEPALNFFQFDGSSMEVLELATYLFAALDRQLTAKQATVIPYLLNLLQRIPGATLDTLRKIMDDRSKFEASPWYDIIMQLDERTQDFFRHQFYGPELKATKQQVANRLYTILGNESFVKMFAAPENRFSAYEAMQEKKIVLVNTSQRVLGETASSIFGRFIIAQVLAGAYKRDPDADNHLALLVIDEAFEYFDDKTERILSQARKYGVGLLFATQYLEQMPQGVKAAVNASTAIKLAGPVSYNDAMMLSREMYTTGEFLRSMKAVDRSHAEFACHVRNLTGKAVKLTIPYGTLEKQPSMSNEAHVAMRARNRDRYGSGASIPAPEQPVPQPLPPGYPPEPVAPDDPSKPSDRWV